MNNYLPPMLEHSEDQPNAVSAYLQLGAMALLDIDYWEGQSQQPLGNYYDDHLRHMQNRSVMIKLGEDRKPIGYAAWDVDPDDETIVHLRRQSAPFGDHLALQNALKQHLPDRVKPLAHHPRSAREVQNAWDT